MPPKLCERMFGSFDQYVHALFVLGGVLNFPFRP